MVYWRWHCEPWENQSSGQTIVMCWLFWVSLWKSVSMYTNTYHATATLLVRLWICVAGASSRSCFSLYFPHLSKLFVCLFFSFDAIHAPSIFPLTPPPFLLPSIHLRVHKYNAIDNMRISACAACMWIWTSSEVHQHWNVEFDCTTNTAIAIATSLPIAVAAAATITLVFWFLFEMSNLYNVDTYDNACSRFFLVHLHRHRLKCAPPR